MNQIGYKIIYNESYIILCTKFENKNENYIGW